MCEPLGRLAQTQRDDLRFLLAIQPFLVGRGLRFFTVQSDLNAYGHEALPDVVYRFRPTPKGVRNFFLCPVGAIGIGLEEHVRSPNLLRRTLQLFHHTAQRFSFLVCQANNILFFHGNPPWFSPVSLIGPLEGTLIFKIDRALALHLAHRDQWSVLPYKPSCSATVVIACRVKVM